MYKCKYCNKEFNKPQSLAAHMSHCKLNPNYNEELYKLRQIKRAIEGANKRKEISLLNKKERILICKHCGKEYKLNLTDKEFENEKYSKFCSRSCANSRQHSKETKLKISKSLIKKDNIHICKVCKKQYKYVYGTDTTKCFCSHECLKYFKTHFKEFLSEEAKQSLHNFGVNNILKLGDLKRSKNEIAFCKLCESYFNNVEHNKPIFNGWDADVIIHDIKYAILWNGKWHYEQITKSHSVKQVQNRDKIKIEEIKKYGYIPYIIKDMGSYNLDFVNKEFNKFINMTNSLLN